MDAVRDFNDRFEQCERFRESGAKRPTINDLHTLDLEGDGRTFFNQNPIVRSFDFQLYMAESALRLKIAVGNSFADCRDKAARIVLDGICGHLVEVHQESVDVRFWPFYSVITEVGDDLWSNVVKVENREFYARFAALIRLIKAVHSKGLIVFAVQGMGIGVCKNDPSKVYLVQMQLVVPYINQETGTMEPVEMISRKTDMRSIADLVSGYNLEGPRTWLDDFIDHVEGLERTTRPDYDRWINCFEKIETDELVSTC